MIIDALLILPTTLITYIWGLLDTAQAYPQAVHDAAETLGDTLAWLDFIIPIDTIGDIISYMFVAILAYLTLWVILMVIQIYQAVKLF